MTSPLESALRQRALSAVEANAPLTVQPSQVLILLDRIEALRTETLRSLADA